MGGGREAGFNLIELAVVGAVAALAATALFLRYHDGITLAVAHSAGAKAREVYAAVFGDCVERGGGPSSASPGGAAPASSTELFRRLIERGDCPGLGYDSLVAGGVPAGRDGAFSATNNIWTVAVNVPGGAPDSLPLLLTRNVDLSPLASEPWATVAKRPVRYDAVWGAPFHRWGAVCVRKGGTVFIGRSRRLTYGDLFAGGLPPAGSPDQPLTYLTPAAAVVPRGS